MHNVEPSKFWEFSHCSNSDALYPQPMASLREPLPDKKAHLLEKKALIRGLTVPDTGRVQAQLIRNGMVVQEQEVIKETRRRSVSVPRNAARNASVVFAEPVKSASSSVNVTLDQSMNTSLFNTKTSEHKIGRAHV